VVKYGGITYVSHPDATPETEMSVLSNIYRYVLNRKAAGTHHTSGGDRRGRPENDSRAKAKIP
jgi:hypothetical protein